MKARMSDLSRGRRLRVMRVIARLSKKFYADLTSASRRVTASIDHIPRPDAI